MINLRWWIAKKLLEPNWLPISRSTFQKLVAAKNESDPMRWIGQWPRQSGKAAAMSEELLKHIRQGHVIFSYDPKGWVYDPKQSPEERLQRGKVKAMRSGGPAAAAFMPVQQHISMASEDDLTRMELNRIRTDLLKWADELDELATKNHAEKRTKGYASGVMLGLIATEQRSTAYRLRQMVRGRQ